MFVAIGGHAVIHQDGNDSVGGREGLLEWMEDVQAYKTV
jgi:hypothetical protein